MKKLYVTYLFAHLALCALGGALFVLLLLLSPGYAVSPWGSLTLLPMALAAYFFGRRLRAPSLPAEKKPFWDAAMYAYVLSLALLALLWKFPALLPVRLVNLWNLSLAPVLAGLDGWLGHLHTAVRSAEEYTLLYRTENYQNFILPLTGALLAAAEPLLLTLGLSSGAGRAEEPAENITEEEKP